MAKVPVFRTLQEEREFWQTHDSTDYQDDTHVLTPEEIEAMNARSRARRIAKMLTALRERLGDEIADATEREIGDLLARRCQESGLTTDELLKRKKAA